jgi:hypothetical protein
LCHLRKKPKSLYVLKKMCRGPVTSLGSRYFCVFVVEIKKCGLKKESTLPRTNIVEHKIFVSFLQDRNIYFV